MGKVLGSPFGSTLSSVTTRPVDSGTLALQGDGTSLYAEWATTQVLASGDTATFVFANTYDNTGDPSSSTLLDGLDTSASRGFIKQNQVASTIAYSGGNSTCTLDGATVTELSTAFPLDGLAHTIVLTATGAVDLASLFINYALTGGFGHMAIISISTTTAARGTESWVFNTRSTTVIKETGLGTGSDINLINVVAEDWVTVPL